MGDFKSILIFFSLLVPLPTKADSLVAFRMKQNSIYISELRVKWRQQKVSLVFPLFPMAKMLRIFRVLVQQHTEDWNVFGQNAAICKCFRGISQMGGFIAIADPDWVLNQSAASSYGALQGANKNLFFQSQNVPQPGWLRRNPQLTWLY